MTDCHRKRKPAEKRLFHRPLTAVKLLKYCLLTLLLTAGALAANFIYMTAINPRAAFPDATSRPYALITPKATQAFVQPKITPSPTRTYSPEELLQMQADTDFMKDRVNILLAGIDYSAEREGREDFRTDTLLLVSVNFASGGADMISVPRDSYADIAFTKKNWKINGAFMSAGGAQGRGFLCMMQTVSMTLGGIPINYYATVQMQGVKNIVDYLGGVWYNVDYEINMNGRHLDKGYQLLGGQAVLDYCRARKGITSGTDIDRIDRQQRLLMTVFTQLKDTARITDLPAIYDAVKSDIYTNLDFEQIAALALFAAGLDESECSWYKLAGEYTTVGGSYYYVLDHRYTEKIIREIFGIEPVIDWSYSLGNVKTDNTKDALNKAINNLSALVKKHKDILTDKQRDKASSAMRSAKKLLKSGSIGDMDDAADALNDLYSKLSAYIKDPPPSPTPSETATPKPSVSPSSLPSVTPSSEISVSRAESPQQ